MAPTRAASRRSSLSRSSSHGLAIAVKVAASTPSPRASRTGAGAAMWAASEPVAPAYLEDDRADARVQVEPLQVEQRALPELQRWRLRVGVEPQHQLRLVLQQEAEFQADGARLVFAELLV